MTQPREPDGERIVRLETQHDEVVRRLDEKHQRIADLQDAMSHKVSREMFDEKYDETTKFRESINVRMAFFAGGGALVAFLLNLFLTRK